MIIRVQMLMVNKEAITKQDKDSRPITIPKNEDILQDFFILQQ